MLIIYRKQSHFEIWYQRDLNAAECFFVYLMLCDVNKQLLL